MKAQEDGNRIFEKVKMIYSQKAHKIASCDKKIKELIETVTLKIQQLASAPFMMEARFRLEVFVRMLNAHLQKRYKGLSSRSIGLMVLGLFYFALPVDLVPDFIPFIGYVDDLTLLLTIYRSMQTDIENFLAWEKSQINSNKI